ncbi:Importin subunit alpha [Durusdinium trenchii]|uniref:Importin subunit alpha n=1 Tax=Durusdinium trenchii TaxID=1381693 RepID=A0ABP0SK42_9DINO
MWPDDDEMWGLHPRPGTERELRVMNVVVQTGDRQEDGGEEMEEDHFDGDSDGQAGDHLSERRPLQGLLKDPLEPRNNTRHVQFVFNEEQEERMLARERRNDPYYVTEEVDDELESLLRGEKQQRAIAFLLEEDEEEEPEEPDEALEDQPEEESSDDEDDEEPSMERLSVYVDQVLAGKKRGVVLLRRVLIKYGWTDMAVDTVLSSPVYEAVIEMAQDMDDVASQLEALRLMSKLICSGPLQGQNRRQEKKRLAKLFVEPLTTLLGEEDAATSNLEEALFCLWNIALQYGQMSAEYATQYVAATTMQLVERLAGDEKKTRVRAYAVRLLYAMWINMNGAVEDVEDLVSTVSSALRVEPWGTGVTELCKLLRSMLLRETDATSGVVNDEVLVGNLLAHLQVQMEGVTQAVPEEARDWESVLEAEDARAGVVDALNVMLLMNPTPEKRTALQLAVLECRHSLDVFETLAQLLEHDPAEVVRVSAWEALVTLTCCTWQDLYAREPELLEVVERCLFQERSQRLRAAMLNVMASESIQAVLPLMCRVIHEGRGFAPQIFGVAFDFVERAAQGARQARHKRLALDALSYVATLSMQLDWAERAQVVLLDAGVDPTGRSWAETPTLSRRRAEDEARRLEATARAERMRLENEAFVNGLGRVQDRESLAEWLDFWERCAGRPEVGALRRKLTPAFIGSENVHGLVEFLRKLEGSADFARCGARELGARVVEALDLIITDAGARAEILERIVGSVDACNDKPILALSHCHVLACIAAARGDRDRLRHVGRRVFNLGVVHKHCDRLIRDKFHGNVDTICVYLHFEIACKEVLDLPVSAEHLIFDSMVRIEPYEIDAAIHDALNVTDDAFDLWLSHWTEWQRQDRLELSEDLSYAELKGMPERKKKRSSLSRALSLLGDRIPDPIILVAPNTVAAKEPIWSLDEFYRHWVPSGLDLFGVPCSPDQVRDRLRVVV